MPRTFELKLRRCLSALSREKTREMSLQSIQNEETVNLVDLAFYLLIED
jgi:hypothetical protein